MKIVDATAGKPPLTALPFSEQMTANANRIEYETDAAGRTIGVRRLNLLDAHRLAKLVGPEARTFRVWIDAFTAASVVTIDADHLDTPGTGAQLKAVLSRLDLHGLAAARTAMLRFNTGLLNANVRCGTMI